MVITMYLEKKEENDFIKLYISGITGKVFELVDININVIYKISTFHSVTNIIAEGLKKHNIPLSNEFSKFIKLSQYKYLTQSLEKELISNKLDEEKIPYLFLKGSILNKYYPLESLREMADIDMLVRKDSIKKVNKIMIEEGYQLEQKGACHNVFLKKPFISFEVHKILFEKELKLSDYNKDVWNRAIKKDSNREEYILTNEEFYIYNVIHAAKHFRIHGTGVKMLADIYLYIKNEKLDFEYINMELKKYNLVEFSNIIMSLANNLFDGNKLNEDEINILKYLMISGTYGVIENFDLIEIANIKKGSYATNKNKVLLFKIFPPFRLMVIKYPILQKCPILLPFFYIVRLLGYLFNFKKIKNGFRKLSSINEEEVEFFSNVLDITNLKDGVYKN